MKNYLPRILTETWLFLAYSVDSEFKGIKSKALNNLIKAFGNIAVAEMYLETFKDEYKKGLS